MTTPRELAEQLNAALNDASARCDESLSVVRRHDGLGELNVYSRMVGEFLGHSYTNILAPLWAAHPDLAPKEMNEPYVERQATLSPESREAIVDFLNSVKPALELAQKYAASVPSLPFGGLPEVVRSVEEIEDFLKTPRFLHDPEQDA